MMTRTRPKQDAYYSNSTLLSSPCILSRTALNAAGLGLHVAAQQTMYRQSATVFARCPQFAKPNPLIILGLLGH